MYLNCLQICIYYSFKTKNQQKCLRIPDPEYEDHPGIWKAFFFREKVNILKHTIGQFIHLLFLVTGPPVVSSVIKWVCFSIFLVVDQTKCVSHSFLRRQLMLIHTKMFDGRMFRKEWRGSLIGNAYKWKTINELTSVQIPNRFTMTNVKLPVYKYKQVNLGPEDQFRGGNKKAAIVDLKKNIFERASMTSLYVYMIVLNKTVKFPYWGIL